MPAGPVEEEAGGEKGLEVAVGVEVADAVEVDDVAAEVDVTRGEVCDDDDARRAEVTTVEVARAEVTAAEVTDEDKADAEVTEDERAAAEEATADDGIATADDPAEDEEDDTRTTPLEEDNVVGGVTGMEAPGVKMRVEPDKSEACTPSIGTSFHRLIQSKPLLSEFSMPMPTSLVVDVGTL
jgi:hypothetical protein